MQQLLLIYIIKYKFNNLNLNFNNFILIFKFIFNTKFIIILF
jgi:hypothetical protein